MADPSQTTLSQMWNTEHPARTVPCPWSPHYCRHARPRKSDHACHSLLTSSRKRDLAARPGSSVQPISFAMFAITPLFGLVVTQSHSMVDSPAHRPPAVSLSLL